MLEEKRMDNGNRSTKFPIIFGRVQAEKNGLAIGKKVIYEVYTRRTRESKTEHLSLRKNGVVCNIWNWGFVVRWDLGGWKECFPFLMMHWFWSTELTREIVWLTDAESETK